MDEQDDPQSAELLPPLTLTETPATMSPPTQADSMSPPPSTHDWHSLSAMDDDLTAQFHHDMQKRAMLHSLHPYKLALVPADLESCVVLETAVFPIDVAGTRDKVRQRESCVSCICYRLALTNSPEQYP